RRNRDLPGRRGAPRPCPRRARLRAGPARRAPKWARRSARARAAPAARLGRSSRAPSARSGGDAARDQMREAERLGQVAVERRRREDLARVIDRDADALHEDAANRLELARGLDEPPLALG